MHWIIDAVQLGELRDVPAELVHHGDRSSRVVSMPLVMFVLRSGDRTVVVDTGGLADEEHVRRKIPFGYVAGEPLEAALDRLGVRTGDVGLVVNTHLHWDHCSNNGAFRNAEILVQRVELDHALAAEQRAYEIALPFTGWQDRIRVLDGDREIAPGLGVVLLPGHSPASPASRAPAGHRCPSHDHAVVEKGTFGY
ncbi:MBL fold metallo-hydrolase [Amycolatopsis sp. RTGN1]|uniref:MBL fold metallo-hydrolase n=1 Tax=Amycolatopsis ponsaeliensis TaxID=2992142 RepID=UPI00255192D0|nr:MBL fold metallo-hydrolase [Amycolatopsis sp. RTGN1]